MAVQSQQGLGGARHAVQAVNNMAELLRQMLERASSVKDSTDIEPALSGDDLADLLQNIESTSNLDKEDPRKSRQFSIIEIAVRDKFDELLASSSIDEPSFVQLWNLLDIVSIMADDERCDAGLVFHLIEELLDSQTITGCRKIFDYLESRREKITAQHFLQKNLIILRSCNELLRRLSRAEDTAFCGRVFIFLFQSFPLGDKSSVNLRGEYHVENVTIFDELPSQSKSPDAMQVDTEEPASHGESKGTPGATSTSKPSDGPKTVKDSPSSKGVSFDPKVATPAEKPKDPDTLYPIFWSLQHSFNQPMKLFDPDHFASFKSGLEDTMVMFKTVRNPGNSTSTKTDKQTSPEVRKRNSSNDDLASQFNPKYLTSRDLFELEISDLSFRRHILVQALIVLDFLLSLSPKAKEKVTSILQPNRAVMYSEHVISEEDTKWALEMKRQIADYIKVGVEGAFFLRMVETVLSRDKNWVRWKMETCPSIQMPAVDPHDVVSAKAAAQKATTNKRLRPVPQRCLDLSFLSENNGGLERLKNPDRYKLPSLASFDKGIADDDFELGMTNDEETKERFRSAKASKTWRALRIASRTKLSLFDKVDDTSDIRKIFADDAPMAAEDADKEAVEGEDAMEVDEKGDEAGSGTKKTIGDDPANKVEVVDIQVGDLDVSMENAT